MESFFSTVKSELADRPNKPVRRSYARIRESRPDGALRRYDARYMRKLSVLIG
jgi:hypothetical protein